MIMKSEVICKFHKITKWNNEPDTNYCKYVKDAVDCDGKTKSDLISCPLWGQLIQ